VFPLSLKIQTTIFAQTTIGGLGCTYHQKPGRVGLLDLETELRGRPLDVWALGCTFYYLLYGVHPFESKILGDNKAQQQELHRRIVHTE
jgi:serine/threonine protein kinase